jgi:hypothetical protein
MNVCAYIYIHIDTYKYICVHMYEHIYIKHNITSLNISTARARFFGLQIPWKQAKPILNSTVLFGRMTTASGFGCLESSSSVTDVSNWVFLARKEWRILCSFVLILDLEKKRVLAAASSSKNVSTSFMVVSKLTRFRTT